MWRELLGAVLWWRVLFIRLALFSVGIVIGVGRRFRGVGRIVSGARLCVAVGLLSLGAGVTLLLVVFALMRGSRLAGGAVTLLMVMSGVKTLSGGVVKHVGLGRSTRGVRVR